MSSIPKVTPRLMAILLSFVRLASREMSAEAVAAGEEEAVLDMVRRGGIV